MSNLEPTGKTRGKFHAVDDGNDTPLPVANVPCDLRPAYIQRLPDWIYPTDGYRQLNSGQRFALHAIAWRADKPDADGNLVGAFSGNSIREMIGCGKSAFWDWVAEFERFGFVVIISRGGGRLGDVVAIPGKPHAMDHRRVERRTSPNGKGGAKPTLYRRSSSVRETDANARVRNTDGNHPPFGRLPPATRTAPVHETETTIPLHHRINHLPSPSGRISGSEVKIKNKAQVACDLPGFTAFYSAYPRAIDRTKARELWSSREFEAIAAEIVSGLERWKSSVKWETEPQYIPGPLKFLDDERWKAAPASEQSDGNCCVPGEGREMNDEDRQALYGDHEPSSRPAPQLPRPAPTDCEPLTYLGGMTKEEYDALPF